MLITYSLSPIVKAIQWMRSNFSTHLLKINKRIKKLRHHLLLSSEWYHQSIWFVFQSLRKSPDTFFSLIYLIQSKSQRFYL